MTYQLPPEIDQRIQSQLALGIYSTPAEVLTSALDALDERDRERHAVQEGIDASRTATRKNSMTSTPNSAQERHPLMPSSNGQRHPHRPGQA